MLYVQYCVPPTYMYSVEVDLLALRAFGPNSYTWNTNHRWVLFYVLLFFRMYMTAYGVHTYEAEGACILYML